MFSDYIQLRQFLSFGQVLSSFLPHTVFGLIGIFVAPLFSCAIVHRFIVRRNKSKKYLLLNPVVSACMVFIMAFMFELTGLFFLGSLTDEWGRFSFALQLIFWFPFFWPAQIGFTLLLTVRSWRRLSISQESDL